MADKITPKDVAEKKDDFVLIDVREAYGELKMAQLREPSIYHLDSL
jgi:hypothetical protein